MRKWMMVTIASFILVMWGTFLYAYPTLVQGVDNDAYFNNYENWVDVDQSGSISAGDYFYGILSVQNINVGGTTVWYQGANDQFSGYFLIEVASVTDPDNDPTTADSTITFKPYSGTTDPYGILDPTAGEVMALYTDTTTPFEYNGITVADDIAKATDGTLWATLTTNGGYWYTPNAPLKPPGGGNKVGTSFAGLYFVQDNTGEPGWKLINDPLEGIVNANVQVYFQSEIEDYGPNGINGTWQFGSNDPATMHPLPEPTTLLLLGTGLIGLAGIGRKKKKK